MNTATSELQGWPGSGTSGGPRATLWLLRAAASAFLLAVLAQPVLAGLYLSGEFDALGVHAAVASSVIMLAMLLGAAALLFVTAGRGRRWPLPVAVLLCFAAGLQTGVGYARELALHVPLGVGIVTAAVLLTVAVWHPATARPRRTLRGAR